MEQFYDKVSASAAYIRAHIPQTPTVGIILGSGLGGLVDAMTDKTVIPYGDIPHFPRSTVAGHAGNLVIGRLGSQVAAALQGRFHYYEGFSMKEVAYPVYVLALLGVKTLIVTNAAGCVHTGWQAGDLMLITDHIKLFSQSPLRGENLPEFGVRFPDASKLYTPRLQELARQTAQEQGLTLREGVYFYCYGPQYETPAEVRAARILGGDAVGMSTAPEVVVAGHCGMEVLGITLLSNMAAGILDQPLSEREVLDAAEAAKEKFSGLIRACLRRM